MFDPSYMRRMTGIECLHHLDDMLKPSDTEAMDSQVYRQREPSHRPIDIEYSSRNGIERRPVMQYEEMTAPREYIPSRAYSVRPEVGRREVPSDFAPTRHESVQPRLRLSCCSTISRS